jgi:WD40 repeat protein
MPIPYSELGTIGPTGDGSAANPWLLTTTLEAPGAQLQIEQRISYVNGSDFIGYEWLVRNTGAAQLEFTLFHAADLYLNGDDQGTGYYNPTTSAIGGRNRTQDQFELFVPATPASAYQEAGYNTIWRAISASGVPGTGFDNTTVPEYLDNGAGLQWSGRTLAPGATESIRDYLSFADSPINPILIADPDRSTVEAMPADVLADDRASATLSVTLLDSQGRPVPGKQVELRSDRPDDRVAQPGAPTDANGQTIATIRSNTPGLATITANDLSDEIQLTNPALVSFVEPPTSDFAEDVRKFTASGQQDLAHAANDTAQVAQIGRYFTVQFSGDIISTIVGTFFDGASLGSAIGGFSSSLASKSITQMNAPGYKAAINASWQGYTKNGSAERQFLKPIYDRLYNGRALTGPVFNQVILSGGKYLGNKLAKKFATELSGASERQIMQFVLTHTSDPFAEYGEAMQELADSYSTELNFPRDELLAALPGIGLTPDEEAIYKADMQARKAANLMLAMRIAGQTAYMQAARAERQAQEHSFCHKWCPFLIKNGAVIGATLVWDGPGYYVANLLGEGAMFTWNRWQDIKKLRQDYRMTFDSLAFMHGAEASLTLQRINQNTMNGLYLVKTRDASVLPQISLGPPVQYSTGECRSWLGTKFVEDGAYTVVDLFNNTNEDVTLEAWATYQHKPGWFSKPVPLYREAPGLTLAQQQSGRLRFDYLLGGEGDTPIDPSMVSITIIGSTSTGTYLVKTLNAPYVRPQRVDAAGNPVDCLVNAPPHGVPGLADQTPPTVGFPLRSSVAQASGGDQQLLTVFVENPLTSALQATVAQPIPAGMAVVDAGGGNLIDGRIEWTQTLGPGQPTIFTATLLPTNPFEASRTLPGTQLTFTDPDTAEVTQFAVPDRPLLPSIAIDLDPAVPDSATAGAPIEIGVGLHSRLSTSALSGTLKLELRDLDDAVLARLDQPIALAPGAASQLTLMLGAPATPGVYMIAGTLAGAPGTPRDFSALINVVAGTPPMIPAITFVSNRDGNDEIYRIDPDGANQQRLTTTASAEGWPGISSDARRITFWSARDGNQEIYVMDADGANQQRLTFNSANDEAPAWSPDGRSIAFMSTRDGNNEIYTMSADGSNQRRLTFNNADDNAPAWSPDGTTITFRSRRDGNDEIYTMSADGSNQRRLTFNNADDRAPAWSPDGSSIAFHSRRDGNWEIYIMQADGSSPRRLTINSATDQTPSWSPDGGSIAFMSTRAGNQDIYVMDADGANLRQLTFTSADDHSPGWSR